MGSSSPRAALSCAGWRSIGFQAQEVSVQSVNGVSIKGNFIGTNIAGSQSLSDGYAGIQIAGGSNNTVGGTTAADRNIVSGQTVDNIEIYGSTATGNLVQGNFAGTDVTGTRSLNSDGVGVVLANYTSGNTVGGTTAAARNVVSGNLDGIEIDVTSTGNLVEGNYIGTDVTGTKKVGNIQEGVDVTGPGNTIGGTTVGAGNVISGNNYRGVVVFTGSATGNLIQGNLIGTDVTGTLPLGNGDIGIWVALAPNTTIGGTSSAARNVISSNKSGILISGNTGTDTLIEGNFIGTDISGTSPLGNTFGGVDIGGFVAANASYSNTVGGTAAGAGNTIAFNGDTGVAVWYGTGNAILGNSIFSNAALGIDLGHDGVTPNDSRGHAGPNLFQDYPVLTSAVASSASTAIVGTLHGAASARFEVDFFASPAADPLGYGEGKTYLGSTSVTTDSSGNASFSVTLPVGGLAGQVHQRDRDGTRPATRRSSPPIFP